LATFVLCAGLAALMLSASSAPSAPSAPDAVAAWASFAGASSDQTPEAHDWTDDRAALDSPDSSDEDGDDDPDAAPGGMQSAPRPIALFGDRVHGVHAELEPWSSRTQDGHSLRGPPRGNQDSSNEDHDDHSFDVKNTRALSANRPQSGLLSRLDPGPSFSPASDNQSVRAP
jgi:hypothetical protein